MALTGSRVIGNKIATGKNYVMPEGWNNAAPTEGTWKMGGSEMRTDAALVLMQPDTTLDVKPSEWTNRTYIQMFKRVEELVEVLQKQSVEQLMGVMGLGQKTAKGHVDRFQSFHKLPPKQAALIFGGDSLRPYDWTSADQKYADAHLRFVSGLYGILRPADDVKPVRDVPMGAKLATKKGDTILDFWGDALTKDVAKHVAGLGKAPLIVLLLSDEYEKAIQIDTLPKEVKVVKIDFVGAPEGKLTRARCQIGRFIIVKRITDIEDVKEFDNEDWRYDNFKSTTSRLVFQWIGDLEPEKKDKKAKKEKESGEKGDKGRKSEKAEKPRRQVKSKRDASESSSGMYSAPAAKARKRAERAERKRERSESGSRSRSRDAKRNGRGAKRDASPKRRRGRRSGSS